MSKYQKSFGPHVMAFYGRINSGHLKPLVTVDPADEVDDPCFGDWLTLSQAESFAKNILKAVAALRKREKPS